METTNQTKPEQKKFMSELTPEQQKNVLTALQTLKDAAENLREIAPQDIEFILCVANEDGVSADLSVNASSNFKGVLISALLKR